MRQRPSGRLGPPSFCVQRTSMATMAASLCTALAAPEATGQSIDISTAHLRTGHALAISVRVRAEDAGIAPLPPRCIEAEWVADGRLWTSSETRVRTRADADPAWTQVDVRHPHRLQGDQAEVRLTLRCGPVYERHFSVFAGPSLTNAQAARLPPAQSTRRKTKLATAPTSTHGEPHLPAAAEAQPGEAKAAVVTPRSAPEDASTDQSLLAGTHRAVAPPAPKPDARIPWPEPATDRIPLPPRRDTPPPATLPTNTSPADVTRLHQTLERLQADHQKVMGQLGVVRARLVHAERSPSPTTWALVGGLLLMALAQLGRTGTERPFRAKPAGLGQTWSARWSTLARRSARAEGQHGGRSLILVEPSASGSGNTPMPTSSRHDAPAIVSAANTSPANATPAPETPAAPANRSWRDGDFGKPSLEPNGVEDLLTEVEHLAADGFPAAAAMTIEHALMQQPGKHPALLLALLDLYDEMGQPWNRERVAAQLEALYNVTLARNAGGQPDTPASQTGLEHCAASLARITRTWRGPDAAKAIDSLLRHPAAVEVLPLAAFRDAVWLHRLASLPRVQDLEDTLELSLEPMHGA